MLRAADDKKASLPTASDDVRPFLSPCKMNEASYPFASAVRLTLNGIYDESLFDNHGWGFRIDHFGAYLAFTRRRAAPCGESNVCNLYSCRGCSLLLGLAFAPALIKWICFGLLLILIVRAQVVLHRPRNMCLIGCRRVFAPLSSGCVAQLIR
jgi:hypothetical protein